MTVYQHVADVGEFARFLRELVDGLDPGRGWYGVFAQRDPDGMRACLDGVEIPPWDVVESLLQDVAAAWGAEYAARESVRAARLYAASAAANDRRPGGRQELLRRLELMQREQENAARRLRAAGPGGTPDPDRDAQAWARDDHRRASARCAELRSRLAAVTVPKGWFRAEEEPSPEAHGPAASGAGPAPGTGTGAGPGPGARTVAVPGPRRAPEAEPGRGSEPEPGWGIAPGRAARPEPAPEPPAPEPRPVRRKPRGARFAGLDIEEEVVEAPSVVPVLPPPAASAAAPRGARFFGGTPRAPQPSEEPAPAPAAADPEAVRAAADAVALLLRMRAEGRSGEAHVVLCQAAAWPADRLPVFAVALHLAGLGADWTTLLWEVSSLPPAGFAAAVDALAAAGRTEDCLLLLRQGVARPADEIADAVVALDDAGREDEAEELLGAFVRARTPEDAARIAESGPGRLVPQLLAAARKVSPAREWDLVHALRMAGIAGV
ncbi:hypothetical protein [uncultured Streptomyces sp.]|uniref:hypothetical protein n=1 Tax=uncultured Streptomyces sp. TaxID=174707 RepID=UPI0026105434|nr:hypothetical protein [uncultured Streptomyces sp.]